MREQLTASKGKFIQLFIIYEASKVLVPDILLGGPFGEILNHYGCKVNAEHPFLKSVYRTGAGIFAQP